MPKKKFDETQLFLVKGDITAQKFDAIVNAANSTLLGGGGVDGAIHRAAGPGLLEECRTIGGCPTGEARITKGYNLIIPYVIHTVGPIWSGGSSNEQQLLQNAYENSLKLAKENNIHSLAFPNISTGVYGFPKLLAAKIAVETVSRFLNDNSMPNKVTFVCFDDENFDIYKELLED